MKKPGILGELNDLKDRLAVPDDVLEKAVHICREAIDRDLVRGRSNRVLAASALYAACRDTSTPRNLKDVEYAANIKRKELARCYRLLITELGLRMPVANAAQCVERIVARSNVSKKTASDAVVILEHARKKRISAGKDPMGLAAAALYLACVKNGEDKTQRDIAEAANVTEVTIRQRYKGLRQETDADEPATDQGM